MAEQRRSRGETIRGDDDVAVIAANTAGADFQAEASATVGRYGRRRAFELLSRDIRYVTIYEVPNGTSASSDQCRTSALRTRHLPGTALAETAAGETAATL